jgi:hypothetical protein
MRNRIRIKRANTNRPVIIMEGYVLTLLYNKFMLVRDYVDELKQAAIWSEEK